MLEMGMIPEVQAATAAFMILFTASCTTFQFLILGMLDVSLAAWYLCIGAAGAFVGQTVFGYLLERYNKKSLIIFCLAFVIALSGSLMVYTGVLDLKKNGIEGAGGLCDKPVAAHAGHVHQ